MLDLSILQIIPAFYVCLILFVLIVVSYNIGHYFRRRQVVKDPDDASFEFGSIIGMLLALLGLLLAFSFNMSNSRYDTRRQLVIEEANAMGTVLLRTDVYPDSIGHVLREQLKDYIGARVDFYQVGMEKDRLVETYIQADQMGKKLWNTVSDYARVDGSSTIASQMIPALNNMIDIATTRRAAGESTIPDSIMYFLFILCVSSSFLLGYDYTKRIDWVVVVGFASLLSVTIFMIIDLDRPRTGLITMDTPNQKIVELLDVFDF